MDGDAGDPGEFFLYAIFENGGDVVHLGDGQGAPHGAVAGNKNAVLDLADMNVVTIY